MRKEKSKVKSQKLKVFFIILFSFLLLGLFFKVEAGACSDCGGGQYCNPWSSYQCIDNVRTRNCNCINGGAVCSETQNCCAGQNNCSNCGGTSGSCYPVADSCVINCSWGGWDYCPASSCASPTEPPNPPAPVQCHFEGCSNPASHNTYYYSYDPICSSGSCTLGCDNQWPTWSGDDAPGCVNTNGDQYVRTSGCGAVCTAPTPTPAQCHLEGCSNCLSHPGYKYSYDPICSSGVCAVGCDNQFPIWSGENSTTDQYEPDAVCAAGCLSGTPTPTPTGTITPTPTPTGGPTNTPIPGCLCSSSGTCATVCAFEKFSDITYISPVKCSLSPLLFATVPSAANKNSWCQATKRTKGDADGNGVVDDSDYYLYVGAANGGQIPATANPDFNGDGEVGAGDRVIIMKILKP